MPKPSPIDDLATSMAAELASDTEKLAGMLKPEIQQVGTEQLTKAEAVALGYREWNNPNYLASGLSFRAYTLKQKGNAAFTEYAQDILKAHGHPPLPALMLQPPTINSGMAPPMLPGGPRVG